MKRKIFNSNKSRIKLDVDEFKPCCWWLRCCNNFPLYVYYDGDVYHYICRLSNIGILPVCTI